MAVKGAKGEDFEARVARLMYHEGGLARRRVNLETHFGEKFTITDVDVLVFTFSPTLDVTIAAGECKTTEARNLPSLADRLLWLTGIRTLVGADRTFLATSKAASDNIRELGRRLGVDVLDLRDLARRESLLGLTDSSPMGSHDPALRLVATTAFESAKRDPDLKRAYWFVRSEVWLLGPIAALKKALGACRLVGSRWSERLPAAEQLALLWLASELVVSVCVALVRIAAIAYRQPEDVFGRYLRERLSEGVADFRAMEEVSRQVDRVLVGAIRDAGLDPSKAVPYLGTFLPEPPVYAEPLTELIERLARSHAAAADLARLADWTYAEALGAPEGQPPISSPAETLRLLRLVATFLEIQAKVPAALLTPISSRRESLNGGHEPQETEPVSPVRETLFDNALIEGATSVNDVLDPGAPTALPRRQP